MNHDPLNYQILDHTADLGIIVKGADVKDLFIRAAHAMMDLMVKEGISERRFRKEIFVEGDDLPDLMVKWLGEILYLFEGEQLLVREIDIESISPTQVQSACWLVPFEEGHHQVVREIKAVTYHQISVERKDGGWEARIIFDI